MRGIPVAALALLLAAPAPPVASDPAPETVYEHVVASLIATFGFVPPTALVDGVEAPTEQALALLRANAAPLPQGENLYFPPDDVGFGVRQGGSPCLVAAILTAQSVGYGEPPPPPLEQQRSELLLPGGTIACGVGFAYGTGLGGAGVSSTADFAAVCVNAIVTGGWLNNPGPCHVGNVEGANMVGHVGFVDVKFSFFGIYFHIQQMFCGVKTSAPGPAGIAHACVVTVAT